MLKWNRILMMAVFIGVLLIPVIGVQAECKLNGVSNGGDVGTSGNDTIVCDPLNIPVSLDVDGLAGNDDIRINSYVDNSVIGGSGNDQIEVKSATIGVNGAYISGGYVRNKVNGDAENFSGDNLTIGIYEGGDDSIFINGLSAWAFGSYNFAYLNDSMWDVVMVGSDVITMNGVSGPIIGDHWRFEGARIELHHYEGGSNDITINGTSDYVSGEQVNFSGLAQRIRDVANGADVITVNGMSGNIFGDQVTLFGHGQMIDDLTGGADTITVNGMSGNIFGDDLELFGVGNEIDSYVGGSDIILINGKGGNIYGDYIRVRLSRNLEIDSYAGGSDIITVSGSVSSVFGEDIRSHVNFPAYINNYVGGSDMITISGTVKNNVYSDLVYSSGNNIFINNLIGGDDTVTIIDGATVGGTIYMGDEVNGDKLIFVTDIINEEKSVQEIVNFINSQDVGHGKMTFGGETFKWDNVEIIEGIVRRITCFGADYRMNKTNDGCSARSQAEKDAIQWQKDNPGNDGRLPGLEGCAVYPYGQILSVYQIIGGAEGVLVADISDDIFDVAPDSNQLLNQSADGNVKIYHLTSNELQIECLNSVDNKVQVRILSELTGAVVKAFDKN